MAIQPGNGDIFQTSTEQPTVSRFAVVDGDPAHDIWNGTLRTMPGLAGGTQGGCSIEVDSAGRIYYALYDGRVMRYDPSQVVPPTPPPVAVASGTELTNGGATALTIDPANDNVFVDQREQGVEFTPAGALAAEYAGLGNSEGAVFSKGKLYVSRRGGGILVFGALTQLPIAKTEAASEVLPNDATLHGEVDPDSAGNVTSCEFKYGTDQTYTGGTVPCTTSLPITGASAVSAQLSGLQSGVTYHFQLVAGNANGTQLGADQTFTTPPAVEGVSTGEATEVERQSATLHGSFEGRGEDVHYYFEYGTSPSYGQTAPALPGNDAGSNPGFQEVTPVSLSGLQGGTEYHYRLVTTNLYGKTVGEDRSFTTPPAVTNLIAEPATGITDSSAELHASLEADSFEVHYYFEWGQTTSYGNSTPVPPGLAVPPGSGHVDLPAVTISGLEAGVTYHYRVVASNATGITYSGDAFFRAAEAPRISGLDTRKVTATSAELIGLINPNHGQTSYHFEWGPTASYGNSVPVPAGEIASGDAPVAVSAQIEGLTAGVTYHFRLVASSQFGTSASPDQSFGFYPPACPNSQLRQETRSNDLPDCRAYELVTPSFAQGAIITASSGPVASFATNPSRLVFGTYFGLLPESSGEGMNSTDDLYVATRTDSGWGQRYIGVPGSQGVFMGGPVGGFLPSPTLGIQPALALRGTQGTPSLDRIINYNWGGPGHIKMNAPGSNAPYLWDSSTGNQLGRWPTNLGQVPGGEHFVGIPRASADFRHFVFSSNVVFAEDGEESGGKIDCCNAVPTLARVWPEGSVYDNDLATGKVVLASRTQAGTPFQGRAFDVSDDGSHILMAVGAAFSGFASQVLEPEEVAVSESVPGPLYLRVDARETYEIAPGHTIRYAGSSADGSSVYLTSTEQLTPDDHDFSRDLYVWHQSEPDSLTRISVGDHGNAGDTDACTPLEGWTSACGASVVDFSSARIPSGEGGNGVTDSYLASANGDVYFESPEQLVGVRGQPGERNLYLYRDGSVRYVTTTRPSQQVSRMQVTPGGNHMALTTASNLTEYDSAGHLEMYTYSPEGGPIACVSCRPDGKAPESDVLGSKNGLFLASDGRTFFSTDDPLVPRDTNRAQDIYEYTEGKAQLITSGTGPALEAGLGDQTTPGLVSVSANGNDVYFASIDNLVTQDHNGATIKIYDARTGGGFPAEREQAKCVAADECHGAGSSPPAAPADRTSAGFGTPKKAKAHKKAKKHRKAKHKKHHKKKRAAKAKRKQSSAKQGGKHHG
ncbi:MAG: fibronectin type III domain-containing protein [Solirubrobacterales bacterium]